MTDARLKNANKSAARLRVVTQKGDLYAARSADGARIKIGFSTQLPDRIKGLAYEFPSFGPFELLGSAVATHRIEQQLHRAMQPLHLIRVAAGKELYPASPAVMAVVKVIVDMPELDLMCIDELLEFRRWCRHQAALEENRCVAREVYADRIAILEAAHARWLERIQQRLAAARRAA